MNNLIYEIETVNSPIRPISEILDISLGTVRVNNTSEHI